MIPPLSSFYQSPKIDLDKDFDAMMMMESKDEQDEDEEKTNGIDDELEPKWDERLTRDEVFREKYRPSTAEMEEVHRLQRRVGIDDIPVMRKSFLSVMTSMRTTTQTTKFSATQTKSWSDVTKGSVILKRGLANLRIVLLDKNNKAGTAHDDDNDGDHHDDDSPTAGGPTTTMACHLCLFSKGMALFTFPEEPNHGHNNKNNNNDQLLISLPWSSIARLVPGHGSDDSIRIEPSAPVQLDDRPHGSVLVLEGVLAEWKDTIISCLFRSLELNDDSAGRTTALGWQHAIVYTPAFSEAVNNVPLARSCDVATMINAKDEYNQLTPLLYAVKLGHLEAAASLLQDGQADPNQACGDDGTLPLYWADASPAMTELLLRHGAKKVDNDSRRHELFGRVEATQAIVDRQRLLQQQVAAVEAENTTMRHNVHLLNERGQKIEDMGDKARELNNNAAEFKSLASQLKAQMKQKSGRWGLF
jgi:hypothetical protein